MFQSGDKVRVRYGVFYEGYDLSNLVGMVKSTTSYVVVYLPELNIECKLFQHEVESFIKRPFEEVSDEEIESIWSSQV